MSKMVKAEEWTGRRILFGPVQCLKIFKSDPLTNRTIDMSHNAPAGQAFLYTPKKLRPKN